MMFHGVLVLGPCTRRNQRDSCIKIWVFLSIWMASWSHVVFKNLKATRGDPQGISATFLTKLFHCYVVGIVAVHLKSTNQGQTKIWKLAFRYPLVALDGFYWGCSACIFSLIVMLHRKTSCPLRSWNWTTGFNPINLENYKEEGHLILTDFTLYPITYKDAHTVYTNTRSCPPASQKLYFRVPLHAKIRIFYARIHEFGLAFCSDNRKAIIKIYSRIGVKCFMLCHWHLGVDTVTGGA